MEVYNQTIAKHYRAYRPPIHLDIVQSCLKEEMFLTALDIGCGTGHSSIALSHFCHKVIGIDTSAAMLKQAIKHPKVNYVSHHSILNFNYDLLCYFGVLPYIKQQQLHQHIEQLAQDGTIICCDFDIQYQSILKYFQLTIKPSAYEHKKKLNSNSSFPIKALYDLSEKKNFNCSAEELSNLLLSDSNRYTAFQNYFKIENPQAPLINELKRITKNKEISLDVMVYCDRYKKIAIA